MPELREIDWALEEEEEYTEEELARFSIMMQNALGEDARAAEYITACMQALRGEAEMPMLEREGIPSELPDVYAFGVPVQAGWNLENAEQEQRDLYHEVLSYPGALEAAKGYIKDFLPEGALEVAVLPKDATKEEIEEAEQTLLDKAEAYVLHPETLEGRGFNWDSATRVMLKAAMKEAPEKIPEEEIEEREKVAPWYARARTPELYAAAKAFTEAMALEPKAAGITVTTGEIIAEEPPLVTVEPKILTKSEVGEATNRLTFVNNKIEVARGDIEWAIEGVFQTYLPHMSLKDRTRYFESGITPEEITTLGIEGVPPMGWIQQNIDYLHRELRQAVAEGRTEGNITLLASQIGRFLDIVNTYPDVEMTFFDQLDLTRSIPRDVKQLVDDVLAEVLERNSDIRGYLMAEGWRERGISGVGLLDQAFAAVAPEAAKRYREHIEVPLTPSEQRMDKEFYRAPMRERIGYQDILLGDVLWNFEKTIEKELFPEPTYVFALTKFKSSRRVKPEFQRFPMRLPEEERVEKGLMKGIRAYFPHIGAPEPFKGEGRRKEPEKEPEREFPRRRVSGFPTIRYRKRRY